VAQFAQKSIGEFLILFFCLFIFVLPHVIFRKKRIMQEEQEREVERK
jgi:hypothetical protein